MVESNALHKYEKLRPYLPVHLASTLKTTISVEEGAAISDHISCLRNVLATYLPRCLLERIQEDPTPGRMIGRFLQGSVVFADVSGFTAMLERLSVLGKEGAEEMTLIVNEYFETMLEISNRYGGDLLKFGGDALMIFFGGIEGPYRAMTVAREMQDSMSKYQGVETSQGTFALQMSIGIGSGPIFLINLGNAEEMDYAVMGTALAGMAKAEDLAMAGQIIVDRATQDGTMDMASFKVVGDDLWLLDSLQPWKFVAQDCVQERKTELPKTASTVEDALEKSLLDLAFIEALKPYVPDELFGRLIPDPGRPIRYGSHRPVTMMFTNFYGIDEIINRLGQEHLDAISKILNEYFASVSMVINQYGGTISRVDPYVVGHRILVLFGALQAHEDDPERAVRAGLDMNRVLEGVNRRLNEIVGSITGLKMNLSERPLKQRTGINTGFVFAGNVGSSDRREFTVMGDQVNLTARLMRVAREGEVLIGRNTSRHIDRIFMLDEKESVKVKGITDPVRNYVVQAEVKRSPQRVRSVMSPIVGRDAELGQGREAIDKALSAEGCVLVVNGVSGIGKTRLVDEIIAYGTSVGMDMLLGTCLSYGSTLTYHPWAEVLRTYFGIRQLDDSETRVRAVEQGMESIGEKDWTPVIGSVLGLDIPDNDLTRDLEAKLRRQRILDLIVELLQVRSQSRALILVIEDAHWADSASMELIDYVARNISGYAILMVLPHRPDDGLPDWKSFAHSMEIPLKDLSEQASKEIVQGMLGPIQLPGSLRELIQSRASGNPFFIKELVHALIDSGALEQDTSGQWRVIEGRERVDLPDTIHGIVISRVDRLDATHRRILQAASVLGRVFPYQTLAGVYAVDEPDVQVHPCLASMQDVGLIEVQDMDLDHYRFTHLTTQEVVYDSLSYELRRNLHCGIGDYIEDAFAERLSEQIDLLAYHYFEGQSWSKAANYNLLAGENAQRAYANDAAITSFRRVLEAAVQSEPALDTSKEEVAAHERLGEVLFLVGKYEGSLENYTEAMALVDQEQFSLEQTRHRSDLCRKTAEVYERWSKYDVAFQWLERGLDVLREDEPSIEQARIFLLGAGIFHRQGKNEEAIRWSNRSLETSSQITSQEGQQALAQVYYLLGAIHYRLGNFEEALESCQKSLMLSQGIEDLVGEARAYNNLAIVYSDMGEWRESTDAYDKSLSINLKIGNIQEQGFVANNLGNIHLYSGNWDEAAALYKQSNAIWKKIGAPLPDAVTLSNLAQVHLYKMKWDEACATLVKSQEIFENVGSEDYLPELERRWAEYYLKTGEPQLALVHIDRSIQLASEQESRLELGMSFRVSGEIHLALGDYEASEMALLRSLRILRDLESDYQVAKTMLSLAYWGFETGDIEPQRRYLFEAIKSFTNLGAKADLRSALDLEDKVGD